MDLQHEELESKYRGLSDVNKEREGLEKQVVDLRFQVAEFDALSVNNDDMQVKVNALSAEVKEKVSGCFAEFCIIILKANVLSSVVKAIY